MEENKICPIMSRPLQGPNSAFKNEADMVEQNWYPINGVAWENVFPCVREKCMAFADPCPLLHGDGMLPEACLKYEGKNTRCHRNRHICEGYCKLIERDG